MCGEMVPFYREGSGIIYMVKWYRSYCELKKLFMVKRYINFLSVSVKVCGETVQFDMVKRYSYL